MTHSPTTYANLNPSPECFREFVEMSQELFWECDADGRCTYLNPAWESTLGYSITEMLGKRLLDFQSPVHAQRNGEALFLAKNGEHICLVFNTKVIRNELSEIVGTRGTAAKYVHPEDVTSKLMELQKALQDSKELLSAFMRNSPIYTFIKEVTPLESRVLLASENFINMIGISGQDMTGKTMAELFPPEFAEKITADDWTVASKGDVLQLEEELNSRKYLTIKFPLRQGEKILLAGYTIDMTDRNEAERLLHETEKNFRALFEKGPIGVAFHEMIYDDSGKAIDYRFIDANHSYLELTGVDPRGKTVLEAFPGIEKDSFDWIGTFGKVAKTGEEIRFETYLQANNRWYDCVGYQYKPDHFVAAFIEITSRKKVEMALQESESRYRGLIENINAGVVVHASDTSIILCNSRASELLGLTLEQMKGRVAIDPGWKFLDSNSIPLALDKYPVNQVIGQNTTINNQIFGIMRPPNQEVVWVMVNGAPILNSNGDLREAVISFFEITDQIHTAKVLAERTRFVESLVNLVPGILYIYDIVEQCNVFSNHGIHRILGYSVADVQSLGSQLIPTLMHPDDLALYAQNILPKYAQASDGQQIINQYRMRNVHGEWHWIESTEIIYKRGVDGSPQQIFGVGIDITERKEAEEKLRESEVKWRTLFGSMTEMVVLHELVFNAQGEAINYRIIDCNLAFTQMTGLEKNSAIGSLATDVYHTDTAPFLDVYSKVALTGESHEYSTFFEPLDKYFSISVVSPKTNYFATITTDITSIRHSQDVILAKNKELENYLYVASHDLRSPLVNMQGFSQRLRSHVLEISEILETCNLDAQTKESLESVINEGIPKSLHFISSSVSKMNVLINGLLEISRTGRMEMTVNLVDMDSLIKSIISSFDYQVSEISATVVLGDLPDCYGDKNLLNQLFSNLISNAIKYRDSKRTLRIEVSGHVEYGKAHYTIRDNGIGIEDRHLDKIWNVFFRVNSAAPDSGEGLGLSIIRRIAERHRGRVWVDSEKGSGSRFHVELPIIAFVVN